MKDSPFGEHRDSLLVMYYAAADVGCFLTLGWDVPQQILDLYVEFSRKVSGLTASECRTLAGALAGYGINVPVPFEKGKMRDPVDTSGLDTEKGLITQLSYSRSRVDAVVKLLHAMRSDLGLPRAALRGRYMAAAAKIERHGVPIDMPMWNRLKDNWNSIRDRMIDGINPLYGVYDGLTFKSDLFAKYLSRTKIRWPHLESGQLALDAETFKYMSNLHPELQPLAELRKLLSAMRSLDLAVGPDGRNRTSLCCFRSKTGRNQPSTSKFIYGQTAWGRSLIKPHEGSSLAYIDWSQQEFGIAAALSGDKAMKRAYLSGDPYLEFAKQANAVPEDATKDSHSKAASRNKLYNYFFLGLIR